MPHRLTYSGRPLDRAALNRQDSAWLAAQLNAPNVRLLTVWQGYNLIATASSDENPVPAYITGEATRQVVSALGPYTAPMFLGLQGSIPVFALDLSPLEEMDAIELVSRLGTPASFMDIRSVGSLMPQHDGSVLAYARGLAFWHQRHHYCGACGSVTTSEQGGHVRRCLDPKCGINHFPRTDPAVIMLVTAKIDGEPHCLLGRQASWAPGMYSSLAGFVEPGESLEVAVAREVLEEAGIEVTDVTYRGSQPWPFPSSLMLGFRARATTFDVDVGNDELEDAQWFSHREICELANADRENLRLSRSDSIARWLIEDWMYDIQDS